MAGPAVFNGNQADHMNQQPAGTDASRRFWNARTAGLVPYVPGEQPRGRRLIKLNTNENPYPPPPGVIKALQQMDLDQLRLYPDPSSLALRQAIADYHGLSVSQVFVGNGSDEVLAMAFQAFFEAAHQAGAALSVQPEQALVFPDITYSFYPVYARMYGLAWRTVALDEQFRIPLDPLSEPSAGIILANPNAPTGIALGLEAIAALAMADRNRLILVDEAYVDFGAESAVSLLGHYDNLLVVQTLSKSRALAGIRLGYALGAPGLIEALERIRDSFNSYTLDRMAQNAGIAAFAASAWFESMRARIIATRERLSNALQERGFTVLPSAANFLFASCPGVSGADLYRNLREQGILVRHFSQSRIADFVRITIGTDADTDELVRVLDRLLI